MRPHDLDNVGDEPIYCETQHDDVLYSGSEDDYYEAPEHRRLRVEAKAVQFLNGNLPYLLSAKLRGPFDAQSWNNPWKSKRAHRQAVQRKSHSRRSTTTVEAARGHSSDQAIDDLPDTQRTSLYPLPSPEITNPPSARKNPFMPEEEYNRIKTWRATVKKVPTSTDPFWTSQQNESQRSTATRKRSTDQDWLRKRESKKRKSEDLRALAPEESPSQAAAKTSRSLLPNRLAEIVTQSALGSSTHEIELTAHWGPNAASFDTTRMANIPTHTPDVLQIAQQPQSSARLSLARDLESSEDELSMPSITPSRNASRSPAKIRQSSIANESPGLRKRDSGGASQTRGCCHEARLDFDTTTSQRSVLGKAGYTSSQRERTSTGVPATQSARQDMGKTTLNGSPVHIPLSQGSRRGRPTRLAKNIVKRAVGASQQDNSFYFHQAAPKNLPPGNHMYDTTLRLPPPQPDVSATATKLLDRGGDQECAETDDVCAPASSDDQMDLDPSNQAKPPPEAGVVTLISDEDAKVVGAANLDTRATQPHITEALPAVEVRPEEEAKALRQPQHERLQICTNTGPDLPTHACTQELSPVSPVSMQDKTEAAVASATVAEDPLPMACHTFDDVNASNTEWSIVDEKGMPTGSERPSSFGEVVKDGQVVSQGADDPNDPDWTTYVNTQNTTSLAIENITASKVVDGLQVVEPGPENTSDSEWSTSVDTQDEPPVKPRSHEVAVVGDELGLDLEPSDHNTKESPADDTESNSESSSYLSASSQGDANSTGDTSNEPVLPEALAPESKSSQVSLGAIINAYAEGDESQDEFEDCPENQLLIGDQQGPKVGVRCQNDKVAHKTAGGRQENTSVPTEKFEEAAPQLSQVEQLHPLPPVGRAEESAINFDGTTASFQSSIPIPSNQEAASQSPWAQEGPDLHMPAYPSNDTPLNENVSRLGLLAGQALAFSPALQTPWIESQMPSPDFSMSVKRFSDFMKPSPSKKRTSAGGSIMRSSDKSARVLFGTPTPAKPRRRVTFAPLPGEEDAALAAAESKDNEGFVEEDLSYFDAKGNKTAYIRITRSQTRAASPPPTDVNAADVGELPDHDHKFARHFELMLQRKKDPPKKTQRLLPSESQQTNGSQTIDAMAEAFIQASQTRKRSSEFVATADDNTRLFQRSSEKMSSPTCANIIDQQENIDPVDDVSAVLDNIDDFLDNSWGFDTSLQSDTAKEVPTRQHMETIPSRFANVGDPLLAMHANVWAD